MVRMFVKHQVADYPTWREVYDSIDDTRSRYGVTAKAVYCSTSDQCDVTVSHDFDSEDSARSFAESPELREAMGRAGVQGAPEIWFTTPA
jgi:hypothetical protein